MCVCACMHACVCVCACSIRTGKYFFLQNTCYACRKITALEAAVSTTARACDSRTGVTCAPVRQNTRGWLVRVKKWMNATVIRVPLEKAARIRSLATTVSQIHSWTRHVSTEVRDSLLPFQKYDTFQTVFLCKLSFTVPIRLFRLLPRWHGWVIAGHVGTVLIRCSSLALQIHDLGWWLTAVLISIDLAFKPASFPD